MFCLPSSLHWYDSTKLLSLSLFCTSKKLSVNFLRLKSSLNKVSLQNEKKKEAFSHFKAISNISLF